MDIQLKQELAAEAFELDRKLSKCLLNIRDNYFELGEVAWKLKQHKRYKLVEPEAKSWEHFISLKFAGISRASLDNYSQASKAIGLFVKDKDIPLNRALDITRIVNRLPEAEQEGKIRELIESAEVLPKEGWDSTIAVETGKTPPDICEHLEMENWQRCKKCFKFFKL
jgi:hypothetical protein